MCLKCSIVLNISHLFFLPWKSAAKLFPSPVGFLNFTFLSVHHAMPFLIKVIEISVPLSMRYNSSVSKEKIKSENQLKKLIRQMILTGSETITSRRKKQKTRQGIYYLPATITSCSVGINVYWIAAYCPYMISICLLHSSNSFSQQVFPPFVCYQIKLILIVILKKATAVQHKIFYSEQ